MIWFALSLLCSSSIYLIFKYLSKTNAQVFSVILINYIVCIILGSLSSLFSKQFQHITSEVVGLAAVLGLFFVALFYAMALTTRQFGVGTSSTVSRISLVIPVLFFAVIKQEGLHVYQWLGVVLAILAVFLSAKNLKFSSTNKLHSPLPFIVFIGYGIIDILLKFSNNAVESFKGFHLMTTGIFLFAGIYGWLLAWYKKQTFNKLEIKLGLLLGLINYGSIYFFLEAITSLQLKNSVLFALNGILILLISNIGAKLFFKEELLLKQKIGLLMAIVATWLLSTF